MRICIDARAPRQGGTRTFTDSFLQHLLALETEHEFVLLTNPGVSPVKASAVEAIHVPAANPILELTWIQTVLPGLLKRRNVDIYHSLKHVGPIFCPVNDVYHLHAVGQFSGIHPLRGHEKLYWTRMRKIVLQRAKLIIAVSDYIRRFVIEHLGIPEECVVTAYNGVDEEFTPLSDNETGPDFLSQQGIREPFLLCVGNVVPVKNHETAIRALHLLKQDHHTDRHLVIAGDTKHPHSQELEQLVTSLGLQEFVRFVGYQSKHELRELYNHALLLVHPSLDEGFGLAEVEAMACGLPVVCPRIGAHPEVVGKGGVYYGDPQDAQGLASTIKGVIDSEELRDSLSREGVTRARRFSWRRCVEATLAAYDVVRVAR